MHASHLAVTRRPSRRLLVSIASTALLASGCSNLVSTAPGSGVASSAASIAGRVHGGNQPVAGATVNLYFAGQAGVAKPGQTGVPASTTLAATTTTADDGAGSFAFVKSATDGQPNPGNTNTFSCPPGSGSPYVYLVARGGNTLNTHDPAVSNAASVFIAPVGLCTGINASTFTYMSEAVTAATVAAVHQFMDEPTGDISADGILASYDALANAFNTVSNMVSLSTGQTIASVTLAGTGSASSVTVTASPEQAKLNHIANILSACINNASATASACGTLFANAVPPASTSTTSSTRSSFTAPTDVLQAAYYMFTNPTDTNQTNLTPLYNLSPGSGAPYQPTLTSVPSDWSIGIQYASSGNCGGTAGSIISFAYDINIDSTGNLWIANGSTANGTLGELSATGLPLSCLGIPGASRGGTIDSGVLTGNPTPTSRTPSNIWIGDSEHNNVYRYTPGASTPLAFPTTTLPFAMAADGSGNVYYTTVTTGSPSVWMIPGAADAAGAVTPVEISATVGSTPARILVDGKGAIWVSSRNNFVSQITPGTGAGNLNGYITTQFSTPTPSYGLAANSSAVNSPNGIYVSIQDPVNQLDLFTGTGTAYTVPAGFPTATSAGGFNVPSSIAVDGASNVWAANDQTIDGTNTGLSVASQFSAAGASLSPDGPTGGYQKAASFFQHGRSIAIDAAGNVWIGKDGSNAVTEIVGGGVPVYQPFALGLANGRFQTIP